VFMHTYIVRVIYEYVMNKPEYHEKSLESQRSQYARARIRTRISTHTPRTHTHVRLLYARLHPERARKKAGGRESKTESESARERAKE